LNKNEADVLLRYLLFCYVCGYTDFFNENIMCKVLWMDRDDDIDEMISSINSLKFIEPNKTNKYCCRKIVDDFLNEKTKSTEGWVLHYEDLFSDEYIQIKQINNEITIDCEGNGLSIFDFIKGMIINEIESRI